MNLAVCCCDPQAQAGKLLELCVTELLLGCQLNPFLHVAIVTDDRVHRGQPRGGCNRMVRACRKESIKIEHRIEGEVLARMGMALWQLDPR